MSWELNPKIVTEAFTRAQLTDERLEELRQKWVIHPIQGAVITELIEARKELAAERHAREAAERAIDAVVDRSIELLSSRCGKHSEKIRSMTFDEYLASDASQCSWCLAEKLSNTTEERERCSIGRAKDRLKSISRQNQMKAALRFELGWYESQDGPLYKMFEEGEIGQWIEDEWTWERTIAACGNLDLRPEQLLSEPVSVAPIVRYRQMRAALGKES